MKNKTGFLGTAYGVNIYADTKDDVVVKQIGRYLEEQRHALLISETQVMALEEKLNKVYWLLGFVCVLAIMFIWL